MTENELKKTIAIYRRTLEVTGDNGETCFSELDKNTLLFLQELEQYRAIGTVEECTKAVLNIEQFYMLGRNKVIDEFAERLKNKYPIMEDCFGVPNVNYHLHRGIDEIAEEMRGVE